MTETNPGDHPLNVITLADNSISLILQTFGGGGGWIISATDPVTGQNIQTDLTQQLQSLLNGSDITVAIKYDGRDEVLDELAGDIRQAFLEVFNDWLYHQTYYIKADPRKNTTSSGINWEITDLTLTVPVFDVSPVQAFINEPLIDKVEDVQRIASVYGFNFIPSVLDGGQSWFSFPVEPGGSISENLSEYVDQVAFVSIEGGIESKADDGDSLMLLFGSLVPQ